MSGKVLAYNLTSILVMSLSQNETHLRFSNLSRLDNLLMCWLSRLRTVTYMVKKHRIMSVLNKNTFLRLLHRREGERERKREKNRRHEMMKLINSEHKLEHVMLIFVSVGTYLKASFRNF